MSEIKFGIFTPPRGLDWIYRTAELAESGNFDSVWMPDHLVGWGKKLDAIDAWTTLGALAAKTKRVTLGFGVTDPHRRHPAILAHQAMTLDQISNGRVAVGIGAGESPNITPYGINFDKSATKLDEFLRVVKGLWTEKTLKHDGEFYHLKNAMILPKPSNVPIYVAGNSPKTMEITASLGDGWLPFKRSPELYKKDLETIQDNAEKAGRKPDDIEPGFLLYTAVSKDRDYAKKIVEREGRMILAVSPKQLKELGYKSPSPEAISKVFVSGTKDDCISGIERYVEAGCKHFMVGILNPGKERDEAINTYSEEIIPHFK